MARNGSGTYSLPPTSWNPAATGTTIESTAANTTLQDIASALTQSLSKDGQTVPTGPIQMGGYKLTSLGDGAAASDAMTFGQGAKTSGGNVLSGNQTIVGNLAVSGTASLSGAVTTGPLTVNGSVSLSGSVTVTGPVIFTSSITLTSTLATSSTPGPTVTLNRIVASGSVDGKLGKIIFNGSDAAGNLTEYASINGVIIDPTNGSEDGALEFGTIIAGTQAVRFRLWGGLWADGLSEQGQGTVNATAYYLNNAPFATVSRFYGSYATNTDLATVIPVDDSTPTSSEGTQIISINVTTTSATQRVRLRFQGFGTTFSSGVGMVAALFRATTCLNAMNHSVFAAPGPLGLEFEEVPGSAATFAYSIRVGAGSGNMRMNGTAAARQFGGVSVATLTADVWEP